MGIRETIEKYKGLTSGAAVVALLAVSVLAWRQTVNPSATRAAAAAEAFYSVDDGATFFAAPADLVPPFEWQGKTACRAAVFTCDGGKTRFVGYLERYTKEAKKELEAARDALKAGKPGGGPPTMAIAGGVEVRKVGADKPWVNRSSAGAAEVMKVTCPGGPGTPEAVAP